MAPARIAVALALAGCVFKPAPPERGGADGGDDAATIDGSDAAPGSFQYVFTSSLTMRGNLGGLVGADAFCQQRANLAALPGTYKAWLSTAAASPATRMTHRNTPYVLVTNTVVANNWTDLTDGSIRAPINVNELGQGSLGEFVCQNGELWSNTDERGVQVAGPNCGDWTSDTLTGAAAHLTSTNASWTVPTCPSVGCAFAMPIYCIGQ